MIDDSTIITTYDNKQVELVYNENILCPDQETGIVDIAFSPKVMNWKWRLVFDAKEGANPFASQWEYNIDGFHIKTTFFNWTSSFGLIELKKPMMITTTDGKQIFYFKIGSKAISGTGRTIHLSVWKVI